MNHKAIEFTKEEIEKEQWRAVPYYENIYEVSNLGRIRTKEGKITYTEWHGTRRWAQRIMKYKTNNENTYKTGYRISLWKDGKSKDYLVARIVASAFISNELLNKELTVNHIDGNRLNNKIQNLEWCSRKENIQKAFEQKIYPQKSIIVFDKRTNESKEFRSLVQASKFYGFNQGYFSNLIRKGKFENLNYKWKIKQ